MIADVTSETIAVAWPVISEISTPSADGGPATGFV